MPIIRVLTTTAVVCLLSTACATPPPSGPMGFFVTSAGTGNGADLGGLAGADMHCQKLATSAGAGSRVWRAYLSVQPTFATSTTPAVPAVNARDRIGKGPLVQCKRRADRS